VIGLPVGQPVTLRCVVEAHPRAIIYWMRGNPGEDEQTLFSTLDRYTFGDNASSADTPEWRRHVWLRIESFREEDEGVYRCIASNSHGRAEGFMRLHSKGNSLIDPQFTRLFSVMEHSTRRPEFVEYEANEELILREETTDVDKKLPAEGEEDVLRRERGRKRKRRRRKKEKYEVDGQNGDDTTMVKGAFSDAHTYHKSPMMALKLVLTLALHFTISLRILCP